MLDGETLATLYREEAGEQLAGLEAALLELERQPEDAEALFRVFRSLHTIKGSGAMAGFTLIAEMAHTAESVFAQVRQGKVRASADLIRLALDVKDMIRGLLDLGPTGESAAWPQVRGALQALLGEGETFVPGSKEEQVAGLSHPKEDAAQTRISWKPHADFFHNGSTPLGILAELEEMGPCQTTTNLDELPVLADLEPDTCYLSYQIVITTPRKANEIRDVFAFVEHISDLRISAATQDFLGRAKADPVLASESPGPDKGIIDAAVGQSPAKDAAVQAEAAGSIRVSAAKLDCLVDLVGELVIAQARLADLSVALHQEELISVAEVIGRLSADLRDNTLDLRMVPIGTTFARLRRLVHDLSSELGKDIRLVTEGAETELDKTMIERLIDPLIHLIRNSCDHGIESPEVRQQRRKNAFGTVRLRAYHSGQSVFVEIHDDGAGLDPIAIRNKAVAGGLIDPNAQLSQQEIYNLIFLPGFSTAQAVTPLSGRGVGMDVVRRTVKSLRGQIEIASETGQGTRFCIRLPLTLAIIEGLLVRVGDSRFILPMSAVEECVELTAEDVERAHGNRLANVRGTQVPYVRLREWFEMGGKIPTIEQIAITTLDGMRFGFVVDAIVGQYQTVIKSLGRIFKNVQGISGATILGDGSVALVIDVQSFLRSLSMAA